MRTEFEKDISQHVLKIIRDDGSALNLLPEDAQVLVHTLTGSNADRKACRNYFAASANHHNRPSLNRLVAAGLMQRGGSYQDDYYYHCTSAGARAVGLEIPS